MFFYLTKNHNHNDNDIKWPLYTFYQISDYTLAIDKGWNRFENIFYKGYTVKQSLENKVKNKDFSEEAGNYVIFDFSCNDCYFYHDNSRSFPLYFDHNTLTNLKYDNLTTVWFDGSVIEHDHQWSFTKREDNTILYNIAHKELNKEQIVDMMCNYLIQTVQDFNTELPILAADSQGVDSTLVRSAFDFCGCKYILVKNNSKKLQPLGWGYKQLYVSTESHVQLTGFCGDELLLRNPLYCQWLLGPYNVELADEFDKVDYSYMKGFFNAKYRNKLKNTAQRFINKEQAFNHTINVAINDFQMWHTDNTITLTPLRNKHIATECMYADADAILDQVIHAGISKEIIKRLNPKLLNTLSKHKNDYE